MEKANAPHDKLRTVWRTFHSGLSPFFIEGHEVTTVLSRIARELDEDILLKKTEERLSRHLLAEGLDATVQDAVLADHVKRVSRRMFDVPDFFFYAIADGLRTLFSRHGRWNGLDGPDDEGEGSCQLELAL